MNYARLLEGRRAVVTSGAHGMGFAIAKLFAKHGARVAICGRSPTGVESATLLQGFCPECFFFQCDVTHRDELDAFCDAVLERFGYVDTIVNNVGINVRELSYEVTDEAFEAVFTTNLKPIVHLNRRLLPVLIEKGKPGSAIHISSVHGRATMTAMASYAASKGAIEAFSRAMAVELGPYGIRSNVVAPGGVFTMPAYNRILTWMTEHPGQSYRDEVIAKIPLDPLYGDAALTDGRAEDIAHACLYFASDMSAYVTGTVLMQDGGAGSQAHRAREFPVPDYFEELKREYLMAMPYPEPGDTAVRNTSGQVDLHRGES
ncbi:MAG: SDR family NAD(P)-dependent oxidoreductase [Bacillota bacterium]|nr:SDR family NAD(P)-dependent oxidoreductase [Bacillota bacterium]